MSLRHGVIDIRPRVFSIFGVHKGPITVWLAERGPLWKLKPAPMRFAGISRTLRVTDPRFRACLWEVRHVQSM